MRASPWCEPCGFRHQPGSALHYGLAAASGATPCACGHAKHWRECQAQVVGVLGSTYRCECRLRGPNPEVVR